jgi:transcriptional regulator with AAA-type ATPase domain/tetratricopeptide (TPR) repeat protein
VSLAGDLRDLQHLIATGQMESARAKHRALARRVRHSAGEEECLQLEFFKAQILAGQDDYASALDIVGGLLRRSRELNLRDHTARCHLLLSGLLLRTGDYDGAKAHAEAAIYFCTWEIDDKALKGDAHNSLGLALKDLGAWEAAELNFRQAIEAYSDVDDPVRNLRASLNLGILLRKMGKVSDAADICESGLDKSRAFGIPIGVCRYALEMANISVVKKDIDQGLEYLAIAREAAETNGYQRERILAIEIDGDLHDLSGDLQGAMDAYEMGLGLSRALVKGGDLEAEFLRRTAGVCIRMARFEDGKRLVHEALDINERVNDTYEQGVCLRVLGEIEIAEGIEGCGVAHLEESVKALSSLSSWSQELAVAEGVLGKVLSLQSRNGSGLEYLLDARRIYSNLGIGSALRDLDNLIFSAIGGGSVGSEERMASGHRAPTARTVHIDARHYGIVTEDQRILGDLERWGPTEARILIEGETGAGKELVARALHAMSRRREAPFVAVDCGALSETLADSELFGHARGAFTGAMKDRVGLIEAANGGTLLLDEIGELSEALQVKLLRVLENGVIRRVGENAPRPVDVRVISATARDLWAEVDEGRFRRDLYYRLKTVLVRVPSLRERPYDIELLTDHYLQEYSERHGTWVGLGDEARSELVKYNWPGNVRELKNVIEALVLSSSDSDIIEGRHVLQFVTGKAPDSDLRDRIADLERDEIGRALKVCDGNRTEAARMLGISRKTLWQKLKQINPS